MHGRLMRSIHGARMNFSRKQRTVLIALVVLEQHCLDTLYIMGLDHQFQKARDRKRRMVLIALVVLEQHCLDTLYIMGLDHQFQKDREWVANSLDFNKNYEASVFETTIRVVGGLLSAYDLSGDKVFLEKATDIADRLMPAWDTPSGVPYNTINLRHGNAHNPGWTGGESILADSGTEQLEFIALSQRTGDPKYQKKVENVITEIRKNFPADGLLPIYINPDTGVTASYSTITFGAMGDSLLGLVVTFTSQHQQSWPERTISFMLERS